MSEGLAMLGRIYAATAFYLQAGEDLLARGVALALVRAAESEERTDRLWSAYLKAALGRSTLPWEPL